MTITRRHLSILCLGLGLTLLSMASVPFILAQDTTPQATEAAQPDALSLSAVYDLSRPAIQPTGDNSYCAMCHNAAWRNVTLDDGHILSLYAPADAVSKSVHGSGETPLGCVDCHGQDAFPHNGPRPAAYRPHAIESNQMCVGCHAEHATDSAQGLHAQAILAGNPQAAVCTDCHGAHNVQRVARQPQLVAAVCADCHSDTHRQWRSSAHVEIGPLGCTTCHSNHSQELRVAQGDSSGLCLNCHKQMPDLWIHASHNTYEPAIECVACHMGAQRVDGSRQRIAFTGSGINHSMNVATATCTTCHEQAPASAERPASSASNDGSTQETHSSPEAPATSFVQLLQGLILGLGLGVTSGVFLAVRGNRHS